ncbi:sodium/hydrogen exchanger 9B2 [Ctenocephalides felis]|uniref:sodium/hydrogen exchanger 9B2 n=1 Tax=Ctenocephalides felis TaxID=7515 RepID=UPI000E6E5073|nr:sodium/hydrogen exchanger 9B2 [Ctenocephalides felis]
MPGTEPPTPPKRRVSIASDPVSVAHCPSGPGGYDNPAFEGSLHPRRKISGVSQHSTHEDIGPVRKKSILHNAQQHSGSTEHDIYHTDIRHNGGSMRSNKSSIANSVYSKHEQEALESSWIYVCCSKCRGEESASSWEPPHWQKICPYPLCPSYRQFARLTSLFLLGLLIWGVVYAILGDTAAPGGALFGLAALTVAAHFGGWLISLTTLPALIGMLVVGIIFQNVGLVDLGHEMHHLVVELRKFALVIILTRAGLEMDPGAFKKLYGVILKLGLIPWTVEAVIMAVMSHYLLDLPWMWGLLLGSIVAAVSPAVVVPCLFRLRGKGYGVAKGIPTLIIAVAGIDDAASVAVFGIISSIMFSSDSLAFQIAQGPVSIIGGIGFGVFWGWLAKYVPEKGDPFVVPLRTLMLFGGGLIAVFGSESIGFEGAGPLAVVAAAFVSCYFWSQQGWEVEDNPVSTAFEIFWMIFEPILFGITGAGIKINELDGSIVSLGVGCLITGILVRIVCTVIVAIRCRLNLKEKFFVALSWMSKATVQAALGPVAMATLQDNGSEEDKRRAEIVLMVCVMSIIVTAPLGAILISLSGPRLLTKTRQPQIIEGWRRSHRPSIRDISIIDEEEERDDLDDDIPPSEYTEATAQNTTANAQNSFQRSGVVELGRPLPNYEA